MVLFATGKAGIGQDSKRFQETGGNRHACRLYYPSAISSQPLLPTNFFFHASALMFTWSFCVQTGHFDS